MQTELDVQLTKADQTISDLRFRVAQLESVLHWIAMPRRPDGTYNNDREACERLAREALTPK